MKNICAGGVFILMMSNAGATMSLDIGGGVAVDVWEERTKPPPEKEITALYTIKGKIKPDESFAASFESSGQCCDNRWFNLKRLNGAYSTNNLRFLLGYDVLRWGKTSLYSPVDTINAIDYREDITGQQKRGQLIMSMKAFEVFGGVAELVLIPDSKRDGIPNFNSRYNPYVIREKNKGHSRGTAFRYSKDISGFHTGFSAQDVVAHQQQIVGMQLTPASVTLLTGQPRARFLGAEVQKDISSSLIFSADMVYGNYQLHSGAIRKDFHAYSIGLNYTLPFAFSDEHIASLTVEKYADSRGALAPSFFQNDWYLAGNYALNDKSGMLFRVGVIGDAEYGTRIYTASLMRQLLNGRASLALKYFAVHSDNFSQDKVDQFKLFNGFRMELMYVL